MLIITCKEIFKAPLKYGDDYTYLGIGEYLKYIIVGLPLLLIVLYVPFKIYKTPGSLLHVCICLTTVLLYGNCNQSLF
jgi:hypothetical protein